VRAATRAAAAALPMPTTALGDLAEWGAGIRPDGAWGVYTLNDGRLPTWAALVASGPREAVAISAALNARAGNLDKQRFAAMAQRDPLWARYLDGDR